MLYQLVVRLPNHSKLGMIANCMIFVGNSVSDDKELPKLLDRDVRLQAEMRRAEEQADYGFGNGGRSQSGDSSSQASDDDTPDIGVTSMADESSDEDAEPVSFISSSIPHIC